MHRPERLADVVDAGHAHQLDPGMQQQAPDDLGTAVAAAADHRRPEALHDSTAARRASNPSVASRARDELAVLIEIYRARIAGFARIAMRVHARDHGAGKPLLVTKLLLGPTRDADGRQSNEQT